MIRALRRGCSVTARRQLRWIVWGTALGAVPFVLGYVLPFTLGFTPSSLFEFTAVLLGLVPLAFASAIIRYRLMDVEVIIKRALVYAAAIAAIAAIYAILLGVAGPFFLHGEDQRNPIIALLATMVVVLLSSPVKNAIQNALDRVYYRDRYDYRRALVGFARDLNSDLDLLRLSERLVRRVTETLVVDRMALLLAPAAAGHRGRLRHDRAQRLRPGAAGAGARVGCRAPADGRPHAHAGRPARRSAGWMGPRSTSGARRGSTTSCPCVSKEGTIAVMALGRKANTEPLSSEDMALLAAVAAQAATALENGRLYGQLRIKADELDRMREFSENILESLNDGLAVVNRDDRVVRWNRRLEELYGLRHEDAVGRRARRDSRRRVLRGAARRPARFARRRGRLSRAAQDPPRARPQRARQRRDDAAARRGRGDRRDHPGARGHLGAGAARRAAADLREDGLDRPARRRRRARGEHAAHRHLELRADADGRGGAGRSEDQGAREDREADLPRRAHRQRPAEPVAAGAGGQRPGRHQRGDQRRAVAARSPDAHRHGFRCARSSPPSARSSRAPSTSCSRCSSTCSSTRATPCPRAAG